MSAPSKGTLRSRVSLLLGLASACSLIIVIGVLFNLSLGIGSVLDTLEREELIQQTDESAVNRTQRNLRVDIKRLQQGAFRKMLRCDRLEGLLKCGNSLGFDGKSGRGHMAAMGT